MAAADSHGHRLDHHGHGRVDAVGLHRSGDVRGAGGRENGRGPDGGASFYFLFRLHVAGDAARGPGGLCRGGIAKADFWETGWESSRLGIVGYIVPFIFVYQPALLLHGSTGEVILAATTAVLGTIALAGAMSGYFFGNVNWWQRVVLGMGSITLIYPGWKTDLLGIALVAIAIAASKLANPVASGVEASRTSVE